LQRRYAPEGDKAICKLQDEGVILRLSKDQSLIRAAMTQLNLSTRAYHRTRSVKLARTIADLVGAKRSNPRIWRRRCSAVPSEVDVELMTPHIGVSLSPHPETSAHDHGSGGK